MQITFNLPHAIGTGSRPSESVLRELQDTLSKIRKHTRVRAIREECLFTFDMPDAFNPMSSEKLNAVVLRILLDSLANLNLDYLKSNAVPGLYQSGVRYGRTVIWDSIPALYARRYGDCKSLTAAMVAEYNHQGIAASPVFRFKKRPDGRLDFHILVQTANGFEDPSKVLGMGQDENAWFRQ